MGAMLAKRAARQQACSPPSPADHAHASVGMAPILRELNSIRKRHLRDTTLRKASGGQPAFEPAEQIGQRAFLLRLSEDLVVEAFVQPQRLVGGFGACVEGPAAGDAAQAIRRPVQDQEGESNRRGSIACHADGAEDLGPRAEGKAAVKHQRIAEEFGNNFGIPREVAEVDPPDAPSGQHPAHRRGQAAEQGIDFAREPRAAAR